MTLRKNPPPAAVLKMRQDWGQHLQDELDHVGMERVTLAGLIGFKHPLSVNQIISGQQGMSLEVKERIEQIFPVMAKYPYPDIKKVTKGKGAPGPHRSHEPAYPHGTKPRPPIKGRKPPKYP